MIKHLKIKNFALIKNLELEFKSGFNVLIGETGSGKSIIINALSFVLGGKANKAQIRSGENEIYVEAIFENFGEKTNLALQEMGQPDDEIIILSRKYDSVGKTECRINGNIVTLSMLKSISEILVDSYGQHDSQILLKTSNHIEILDSYKPELLSEIKLNLSDLMAEYKNLNDEIKSLGGSYENRERLLDLLNFQINEIEQINPKLGEIEEIENRLSEIRNSEKITNSLGTTFENLEGTNSATQFIKNAIRAISNITQFNQKYEDIKERLNSSMYELQDLAENLKDELKNNTYSEFELDELDARLDKLKTLKRKYGNSIDEILQFLDKSKIEAEKLKNVDEEVERLNSKLNLVKLKLKTKSLELSERRKKVATEIEESIKKELSFIGMKNANFKIHFEENVEVEKFTSNGIDNVEFLFSANTGESLKPLIKTISGGEMSRFMLALKNIIANNDAVQTLVFDEIDSGISGEVGSAIAERIALLSKNFQVLCITHLPQVTAMADNYLYVYKVSENNSTQTFVKNLDDESLYPVLAKLSGNKFKTEIALAHAKELKNWANNFKKIKVS